MATISIKDRMSVVEDKLKKRYKFDRDFSAVLFKGTVTVIVTLGAGWLFGPRNMMIAYVLVLGASALSLQNMKVKTFAKMLRLIITDLFIVTVAFIASLNKYWAIPIDLIMIFGIIYATVSHYNHMSYKTFMMLFVFSQYTKITVAELPMRYLMVITTVAIVVFSIYLEQSKYKPLLPPQVSRALKSIYKQLENIKEGNYDEALTTKIEKEMGELAYAIYFTSYKRYFTTYIGRIHFHFYLDISYLGNLLSQMYEDRRNGTYNMNNICLLCSVFEDIKEYFARELTRENLMNKLESFLNVYEIKTDLDKEVFEVMESFNRNFLELDSIKYKDQNKVYDDWERNQLNIIGEKMSNILKSKTMSVSFAARMSITLTVMLYIASIVGYYKFIWAIIPIMSISQPYYEDTHKRAYDRVKSNVLAALIIGVLLSIFPYRGFILTVFIINMYLLYLYKDYYHMSIFLTNVSMCVSAFGQNAGKLLVYRIIYVVIGALIVEIMSRIHTFKVEDGINELVEEAEKIHNILDEELELSKKGKANFNRVREEIVYSAVINQKLQLKNKQFNSDSVSALIKDNNKFAISLGHNLLKI